MDTHPAHPTVRGLWALDPQGKRALAPPPRGHPSILVSTQVSVPIGRQGGLGRALHPSPGSQHCSVRQVQGPCPLDK